MKLYKSVIYNVRKQFPDHYETQDPDYKRKKYGYTVLPRCLLASWKSIASSNKWNKTSREQNSLLAMNVNDADRNTKLTFN